MRRTPSRKECAVTDVAIETVPDAPVAISEGHQAKGPLAGLTLTALGIVFGDIGTSPLYTLKTVIALEGGKAPPDVALGSLSLLLWTLFIITSVKYVAFVMRVDNDGEGGILALLSLLGVQKVKRPLLVAVGLFGAALIYGDGVITPAISVLSALEGMDIATPAVTPYILPAAVAILVALFALQPLGTAKIGKVFGPVMTLWFLVIAALGLYGVAQHPAVFAALNPWLGLHLLLGGGPSGFLVLGGVFLCVTGAEALYADMGHVGARSIRLAWYGLVLPALVLSYAGQTAILLEGADPGSNIFYMLCPKPLLVPLVILSTVATIIASQSIITGAFSMTRQAMQLGWCPRLRITQTSSEGYGQIYIGAVNWILMVLTVALAVGFGKSDNLAAAYGIAVSLTMLLTTGLLYVAMREIWHWSLPAAAAVAGAFLVVDGAFFAANVVKIAEGGWVPLVLAALVWGSMDIWHNGTVAVAKVLRSQAVPVDTYMADLAARGVARVPGTAVFLTRTSTDTPPVLRWHVRQNRALQRDVVALTVTIAAVPRIEPERRVTVERLGPDFWRLTAKFGFMERPDIPALLQHAREKGCTMPLDDVTYYVGRETVMRRATKPRVAAIFEKWFAFMLRNSAHVSEFLSVPSDQIVEIGRLVEI